jgi:hypothetical protein
MQKLLCAAAVAMLLAACKEKPDAATSSSTAAKLEVAHSAGPSTPSAAPASAAPVYSGDPNDVAGLFAKLDSEKSNRPLANPTVEQVFDMLTGKLGLPIEDKKQVAGFTIGARYCMKGVTKTDIHVVACEYVDAPSAVKGVETASVTNKYIKHREVLQHRGTTLSVHQTTESPASVADAKKIKDAFLAM